MKKIIGIISVSILVFFVAGGIGLYVMFGQQISAARSIRKIDEGLYFMEYKGDYGMDKFLEQGGISNPKELEFFLIDYH